jgi:hypothetical protein
VLEAVDHRGAPTDDVAGLRLGLLSEGFGQPGWRKVLFGKP